MVLNVALSVKCIEMIAEMSRVVGKVQWKIYLIFQLSFGGVSFAVVLGSVK